MAKINYVLSIGGTGSRIVESLLHLCDCGYIDADEVKLLIIDSDETCGNKVKVDEIIKRYRSCYDNFFKRDEVQNLPLPLFKTKISSVFPNDSPHYNTFTVSPVRSQANNQLPYRIYDDILCAKSDEDRDAANLMKGLYSKSEYSRDIKDGFYAYPAIGSLIFSRWLDNSSEIQALVSNIANDATTYEQINIFVIASSFGGTGASGFPFVAKHIRDNVDLNKHQSKIHIGGAFILPYFTFHQGDREGAIDPNLYDEAAKNALKYYKDQNITRLFENIYMLACPEKMVRGSRAESGFEQDNWPHLLELFSAFAADDFFRNETNAKQADSNKKWVSVDLGGCPKIEEVQWTAFPNSNEFEKCFNTFLLFNLTYMPLFVSQFLRVHANSDEFVEFIVPDTRKNINSPMVETCDAIKNICWGSFTKRRDEVAVSEFSKKFTELYEYLCYYTEWIYRLVTEYTGDADDIGGSRIITHLFGLNEDTIRERYTLNKRLREDKKCFESASDWENAQSGIEASIKHQIRLEKIYYNVRAIRLQNREIGNDINKAARQLIQSFYKCIADCY